MAEEQAFLGGFGKTDVAGAEVEKTFDINPAAEAVTLEFDFVEVDTWDNERFYVYIDGQQVDLGPFYFRTAENGRTGTAGDISWSIVTPMD